MDCLKEYSSFINIRKDSFDFLLDDLNKFEDVFQFIADQANCIKDNPKASIKIYHEFNSYFEIYIEIKCLFKGLNKLTKYRFICEDDIIGPYVVTNNYS